MFAGGGVEDFDQAVFTGVGEAGGSGVPGEGEVTAVAAGEDAGGLALAFASFGPEGELGGGVAAGAGGDPGTVGADRYILDPGVQRLLGAEEFRPGAGVVVTQPAVAGGDEDGGVGGEGDGLQPVFVFGEPVEGLGGPVGGDQVEGGLGVVVAAGEEEPAVAGVAQAVRFEVEFGRGGLAAKGFGGVEFDEGGAFGVQGRDSGGQRAPIGGPGEFGDAFAQGAAAELAEVVGG